MPPVLEFAGACKTYGRAGAEFRLEMERLPIRSGQLLGVIGPSGCGKSTLLEILALISRPDKAAVFTLRDGADEISLAELWQQGNLNSLATVRCRNLGFVHQAGNLFPFLTVAENILLPARMLGFEPDGSRKRMVELAEFMGITPLLGGAPETLSYGERQRVAIARALIHQPRLVLADEPTSALDPETARMVMRLLVSGARNFGTALVIVSHDHALLADAGIPMREIVKKNMTSTELTHFAIENSETLWKRDSGSIPTVCWVLPGDSDDSRAVSPSYDWPLERFAEERPQKRRGLLGMAIFLAWRDFLYERNLSLCGVLAFTAALIPILLLAGLRYGIVDTMSKRLINNPNSLAIRPYSSMRYTPGLLSRLSEHPSASFMVPGTRILAATVVVLAPDGGSVNGDLVPTAPGDPLLGRYGLEASGEGIVITQQLARSLPGVAIGQPLTLRVSRRFKGRFENVTSEHLVKGILPDAGDWKEHLYVPLSFTEAVERFRDGYAVPELGWPGEFFPDEGLERSYAGFRMYVHTLDDVVIMRDFLMDHGIEAYTFAREVETLQGLRYVLFLVTIIIGGVTLVGMLLSLASFAVSNVQRKARIFAQAGLLGFHARELLLFPVAQMFICAIFASTLSLLMYLVAAFGFDFACSSWLAEGESVCRITLTYVLTLYVGSFVTACLCCFGAGKNLLNLQPAEVLRRNV